MAYFLIVFVVFFLVRRRHHMYGVQCTDAQETPTNNGNQSVSTMSSALERCVCTHEVARS